MTKVSVLFGVAAAAFVLAVVALSRDQLAPFGEWLIYLAVIPSTGFALLFGLTRPWWRTEFGRALMVLGLGHAALFDLSAASNLFNWQVPTDVAVLVVGLVVFGIAYVFVVLCLTPRDKRHDDREA